MSGAKTNRVDFGDEWAGFVSVKAIVFCLEPYCTVLGCKGIMTLSKYIPTNTADIRLFLTALLRGSLAWRKV
jgi:hypothetical protein